MVWRVTSAPLNSEMIRPSAMTSTRSQTVGSSSGFGRNDEHGHSLAGEFADHAVDFTSGADVDATGRFVENENAWHALEPAPD